MTDAEILAIAAGRGDDGRHRIASADGCPSWSTLAREGACRLRIPPQIAAGQTITLEGYRLWEGGGSSPSPAEEPAA